MLPTNANGDDTGNGNGTGTNEMVKVMAAMVAMTERQTLRQTDRGLSKDQQPNTSTASEREQANHHTSTQAHKHTSTQPNMVFWVLGSCCG